MMDDYEVLELSQREMRGEITIKQLSQELQRNGVSLKRYSRLMMLETLTVFFQCASFVLAVYIASRAVVHLAGADW